MWRVQSCCCGWSLRKGSIAIMAVIFPLQVVLFLGVFLTPIYIEANNNSTGSNDDDNYDKFEDEIWEAALLFMGITGTGIYGVVKDKPKKIVKCLMIQTVYLLLIAVATFWLIIAPSTILSFFKLDDWFQVPLVLALSLLFGIFLYFFAVVYSHYRELKHKLPEQIPPLADIQLRVV